MNLCSICKDELVEGETRIGTGDGAGSSYAHARCYRIVQSAIERFREVLGFEHGRPAPQPDIFTRADAEPSPIPMLLWCPICGERHIDEGEFATKPHHTHACQHCGTPWRPAIVTTVGVQLLPGFKNA